MNPEFKQWLKEQEYAYYPIPRERGWIIYSVVADKYGTGFIVWNWEAIYPTLIKIAYKIKQQEYQVRSNKQIG